ncbi:MAG: P-type conjugative transfer protein TrbG [Kiloniellales bacterium]|nr:P-type conjugative transfer protein TrbG [Kiloniellales bacterium]
MRKLAVGVLGASLLTACSQTQPPPAITYDPADFEPAQRAAEPPLPVQVVEVPKPLPLPGQLKPLAGRDTEFEDWKTPEDIAEQGNEAARVEPSPSGYVNAIQVYPYTEGALYQVYAAPEKVSNIVLAPGEQIIAVSAGDTVRWVVGDTTSGEGATAQPHILVKPIRAGLTTNLVITTNRRAYLLELRSTDETYMASVSWTYPQDELVALRARNREAAVIHARTVDEGLDLEHLRFRYAITGDEPPWRPIRAFDDGHKVYIQFPGRLDQGEAPPLFVLGPQGDAQLVNYRVRGRYYIVDRLFAAAELRLGQEPQDIVRISRTDGRKTHPAGDADKDRAS